MFRRWCRRSSPDMASTTGESSNSRGRIRATGGYWGQSWSSTQRPAGFKRFREGRRLVNDPSRARLDLLKGRHTAVVQSQRYAPRAMSDERTRLFSDEFDDRFTVGPEPGSTAFFGRDVLRGLLDGIDEYI